MTSANRLAPGLALIGVAVAVAFAVSHVVDGLSPLVVSIALGAAWANFGSVPEWSRPGLQFASKRLLRSGVVLLGFQLAIGDVARIGAFPLAIVATTVAATFFGTRWLGGRLGLTPGLSLLIATGFSICGASAVAAVEGVADADEEEVAFAIALITICGSLAIVTLPLLRGPLGLGAADRFGTWVGASVHDVGQVVATAATGGSEALHAAVIVKLSRVMLLAPMVAGLGLARRRATAVGGPAGSDAASNRPPILPLFVVGFLAAIALRSASLVPDGWLGGIKLAQDLCLAAALVAMGTGVELAKLRRVGGRPLIVGAASWLLIATVSYLGVLIT